MTITCRPDIAQGTEEWFKARLGLVTASTASNLLTSTYKPANNATSRNFMYELAAQRVTGFVEGTFQSYDMERGHLDEVDAAQIYNREVQPLISMGFMSNDKWGFTLGFSPDALTEDGKGFIEVKSRRQKYQVETIVSGLMPPDYMIQIQTGLMVSEREWCDFISYSGGMPMFVKRIYPDAAIVTAIEAAAESFYEALGDLVTDYKLTVAKHNYLTTERRSEEITAS